jgi:hypothetical protein
VVEKTGASRLDGIRRELAQTAHYWPLAAMNRPAAPLLSMHIPPSTRLRNISIMLPWARAPAMSPALYATNCCAGLARCPSSLVCGSVRLHRRPLAVQRRHPVSALPAETSRHDPALPSSLVICCIATNDDTRRHHHTSIRSTYSDSPHPHALTASPLVYRDSSQACQPDLSQVRPSLTSTHPPPLVSTSTHMRDLQLASLQSTQPHACQYSAVV